MKHTILRIFLFFGLFYRFRRDQGTNLRVEQMYGVVL